MDEKVNTSPGAEGSFVLCLQDLLKALGMDKGNVALQPLGGNLKPAACDSLTKESYVCFFSPTVTEVGNDWMMDISPITITEALLSFVDSGDFRDLHPMYSELGSVGALSSYCNHQKAYMKKIRDSSLRFREIFHEPCDPESVCIKRLNTYLSEGGTYAKRAALVCPPGETIHLDETKSDRLYDGIAALLLISLLPPNTDNRWDAYISSLRWWIEDTFFGEGKLVKYTEFAVGIFETESYSAIMITERRMSDVEKYNVYEEMRLEDIMEIIKFEDSNNRQKLDNHTKTRRLPNEGDDI